MSWIDRELKRRAAGKAHPPPAPSARPVPPAERLKELWGRIERAHAALPSQLQLDAGPSERASSAPEWPPLLSWYRASNGAVLGLTTDGIRYLWPVEGRRRSHNFWIRWDAARAIFVVTQRVGTPPSIRMAVSTLDVERTEHIVKCLVIGTRITPRSVRSKRLWLF